MGEAKSTLEDRPPTSANQALLTTCLSGDRTQIGRLFDLYQPYLKAIARGEWRGALRAKEGISDLVQETMAKGVAAFDDFRGSTEAEFAAWLRQILKRQVLNAARKYQRHRCEVSREVPLDGQFLPSDHETPSKEMQADETRERLANALGQLSAEYMEVIRLRQFENLSWDEIATQMNRSAEAVRKLWARAIVQLQKDADLQKHVSPAATQRL